MKVRPGSQAQNLVLLSEAHMDSAAIRDREIQEMRLEAALSTKYSQKQFEFSGSNEFDTR